MPGKKLNEFTETELFDAMTIIVAGGYLIAREFGFKGNWGSAVLQASKLLADKAEFRTFRAITDRLNYISDHLPPTPLSEEILGWPRSSE